MPPAAPVSASLAPTPAPALAGVALRPGQVLQAQVLAANPGGAVLLETGGRQLAARTGLPLSPGQQLTLRVQSTVRDTVLQLLDARGAAGGELRLAPASALPSPAPGAGAAAGPRLEPLSPPRLAPGEAVRASVLRADPGGTLLLAVGGERVAARALGFGAGAAPAAGDSLLLRADPASGALRVLQSATGAGAATPDLAAAVALLKAALPRQQPLPKAFATLARAARDPGLGPGSVAAAVRGPLEALLAGLPRAGETADPARLAAMVRGSGLFHEARAAIAQAASGGAGAAGGAPVPDLKGRLLTLARALGAAGGGTGAVLETVADAVRGALARIETLQVASARAEPGGQAWYVELPLEREGGIDELRLRIARERRGADTDSESAVWSAELLLAPAGAPALHARVSLTPGGVVAVVTTEDPSLHGRLEAQRPELVALLERARLEVASVRCRCATLPELAPPPPPAPLVSERA